MAYSAFLAQEGRRSFLDPRTKLALVLLLAVFVMGGLGGAAMQSEKLVLSGLPFLLLVLERRWKGVFKGLFMVVLGYGLLALLPHLTGLWAYIVFFWAGMLTRFVVTFVMASYLLESTSVSAFVAAMDRMHVPKALTVPMSVMFRLFPSIKTEWTQILRAMRMRGIHLGGTQVEKILTYQLVPMITATVRIGEELSASALTRGLMAPTRRSHVCKIGFRIQDLCFFLLCLYVLGRWLWTTWR